MTIAADRIFPTTEVRNKLTDMLKSVRVTGRPIGIKVDNVVPVMLTTRAPRRGTPPLAITRSVARAKWPHLVSFVADVGAKYCFRVRFDDDEEAVPIYLVRIPSYRNPCYEEWTQHRTAYEEAQDAGDGAPAVEVSPEVQQWLEAQLVEINTKTTARLAKEMVAVIQSQLSEGIEQLDQLFKVAFARANRGGDLLATPEMGVVPLKDVRDLDEGELP